MNAKMCYLPLHSTGLRTISLLSLEICMKVSSIKVVLSFQWIVKNIGSLSQSTVQMLVTVSKQNKYSISTCISRYTFKQHIWIHKCLYGVVWWNLKQVHVCPNDRTCNNNNNIHMQQHSTSTSVYIHTGV